MDGSGPSSLLERFLEVRGTVDWRRADVGESSFVLYEVDELAEAQIGYAVGVDDDDLTGEAPGQWRPLWLVVGEEEYGRDTLLVDLGDERLPVLLAAEDEDGWAPIELAESFTQLVALLAELAEAARGGAAPEALLARALARTPQAGRAAWHGWFGD